MHDFFTALRMDKRNKVKEKLQMFKSTYTTVDEMMKAASSFASQAAADRLAYRATQLTFFGSGGYGGGTSSSSATPMEINAMHDEKPRPKPRGDRDEGRRKPYHWPGVSDEEHARRVKEGLCFCCGGNHAVRECEEATRIIKEKRAKGSKDSKPGNEKRAPREPR